MSDPPSDVRYSDAETTLRKNGFTVRKSTHSMIWTHPNLANGIFQKGLYVTKSHTPDGNGLISKATVRQIYKALKELEGNENG